MKKVKDIIEYGWNPRDVEIYSSGYQDAIEGILEDIQSSSTISVESIEKYLLDLLK